MEQWNNVSKLAVQLIAGMMVSSRRSGSLGWLDFYFFCASIRGFDLQTIEIICQMSGGMIKLLYYTMAKQQLLNALYGDAYIIK